MNLYGKPITKHDFMTCVGDVSQVAGAKLYELKSGRAKGTGAVDVKTGSGLNFTVLLDRGMDISWADYKGISLSYISSSGVVSPYYFQEDRSQGFLRSFSGGLLTTCGLTYMGSHCTDNGEELGLHGRISNIPADNIAVLNDWMGDEFVIKVSGQVRQSTFCGENIVLNRVIKTRMGDKKIEIEDSIENAGFKTQPFMVLYHFNFGYPIVSSDSVLYTSETEVTPRTDTAKERIEGCHLFHSPKAGYAEQCFYHDLKADADGMTYACLYNHNLNTGIYVKFNKKQLPYFVEWKQLGQQDYVTGLIPATWYAEGRAEARKRGELTFIQPGEIKKITTEVGIVEKTEEIKQILSPV